MVNELELNELEHDQSLITDTEMVFPSVQHINERQRGKPCVMLRLNDEYTDKCFETEVLIDTIQGHETIPRFDFSIQRPRTRVF